MNLEKKPFFLNADKFRGNHIIFLGEFITVLDTGHMKNLVYNDSFKALPEKLW